MISPQELVRRIRLGEDSTLEFKRVLTAGHKVKSPARNDIADELAAMANAKGGVIVFGVDDKTRDVVGVPLDRLQTVETWVREICNDAIHPPVAPLIMVMELPSSDGSLVPVVCVDLERGLFVHRSPGGFYTRIGSSKRRMSSELLGRLYQERSQSRLIRFDESPVPGVGIDALDPTLAARFLRSSDDEEEDDPAAMTKLGIVAHGSEAGDRLSLAGVLLCTPKPVNWLRHAYVQAVSYVGEREDVNYQEDARDFEGPIDQQVFDAWHFVKRNMRYWATKGTSRVEMPQFSERAVFEALVNAVAHRDYSMSGARIRLHMFRDRLELYVPGELVNTLKPESMHLRQYNRNELIVSLLARRRVDPDLDLGRRYMMDRRGDGVPIIRRETRRLSGRLPEYELIDGNELRLVMWASAEPPGHPAPAMTTKTARTETTKTLREIRGKTAAALTDVKDLADALKRLPDGYDAFRIAVKNLEANAKDLADALKRLPDEYGPLRSAVKELDADVKDLADALKRLPDEYEPLRIAVEELEVTADTAAYIALDTMLREYAG